MYPEDIKGFLFMEDANLSSIQGQLVTNNYKCEQVRLCSKQKKTWNVISRQKEEVMCSGSDKIRNEWSEGDGLDDEMDNEASSVKVGMDRNNKDN